MESNIRLTSENRVHYGLTGVSYSSGESDYSGQQLSLPTVDCTVSFGCQGVWLEAVQPNNNFVFHFYQNKVDCTVSFRVSGLRHSNLILV